MQRLCQGCGQTFEHSTNTRGRFCTRACYRTYMATKPIEYRRIEHVALVCAACGAAFSRRKQEVRPGPPYCSRACAGKASGMLPKRAPRRPPVDKTCEECSTVFQVKASKDHRRFCGKACEMTYRRRVLVGEGNPNYRHGQAQRSATMIAFRTYHPHCAVCGWGLIVDVHHITPKSKGGQNTADNLIVLCPNHHRMAERGMLTAAELREAQGSTAKSR